MSEFDDVMQKKKKKKKKGRTLNVLKFPKFAMKKKNEFMG